MLGAAPHYQHQIVNQAPVACSRVPDQRIFRLTATRKPCGATLKSVLAGDRSYDQQYTPSVRHLRESGCTRSVAKSTECQPIQRARKTPRRVCGEGPARTRKSMHDAGQTGKQTYHQKRFFHLPGNLPSKVPVLLLLL